MKGSKLVQLYGSLSNMERKHFSAFVASPFFNRKDILIRYVELMPGLVVDSGVEELNKEGLFAALHQDQPAIPYDDQAFRLLSSELLELLNRFLAYQTFSSDEDMESIYLLRNLGRRNLDKHFRYILRRTHKQQSRHRAIDHQHHLKKYLIEEELGRYLRRNPRSKETNLQATIDRLDAFYLVEKLKTACSMLNNQNVVDLEHDILFLDSILSHLQTHTYENIPLIGIFYRALRMFREPDDATHFHQLRLLLSCHHQDIPPQEVSDAYTFAQNHCIRQINRGHASYMGELFGIYQELIDRELIYDQGELSPWHFKNIVVLGLRLKEFAWVEHFIQYYRDRIPNEFRENAYTYNLAKLRFHQGKYKEVKQLLLQVEYEDLFYNLDSKVMLLKIYYEEDEFDALESLTTTFKTYLDRNKLVSGDHRQRYRNLVRYVRKLSRIGEDRGRLLALEGNLKEEDQVADIGWLREMVRKRL